MIYLRTIHGSRLYNLYRPDSDYDYYIVKDEARRARKRDAHQTIIDNVDTMTVGITTFLVMCDNGVPQALEAMFSPIAEIDSRFAQYRAGYRVNLLNCYHGFRRTAMNMIDGADKQKRHALRILYNLETLQRYGRFNPRLDTDEVAMLDSRLRDFENNFEYLLRRTEF